MDIWILFHNFKRMESLILITVSLQSLCIKSWGTELWAPCLGEPHLEFRVSKSCHVPCTLSRVAPQLQWDSLLLLWQQVTSPGLNVTPLSTSLKWPQPGAAYAELKRTCFTNWTFPLIHISLFLSIGIILVAYHKLRFEVAWNNLPIQVLLCWVTVTSAPLVSWPMLKDMLFFTVSAAPPLLTT